MRFIRFAQRLLGVSLDQVGEMLELEASARYGEARQPAERTLVDVHHKLTDLQRIESALADLAARCSAVRGRVSCALIASIDV